MILSCLFFFEVSAQKDIPKDFCISAEEQMLFDKLNKLLTEYGKKPLKASNSLFYVAKTHVEDLSLNHPDTSICNLSSWSNKGDWTACCHNPYLPQQDCMWDKPKELTRYPYRGYELAAFFEDSFTSDSVINLWSNSKPVLDMLLTDGNFEKKKWVCMGVGVSKHYVSVWFGQRPDNAKKPIICDTISANVQAEVSTVVATNPDNPVVYYIVVSSFQDIKDAKESLRRLKKNGFEHANILSDNQTHRVYIDQFSDLKEAMFTKDQLPYTYKDAWLLKQ